MKIKSVLTLMLSLMLIIGVQAQKPSLTKAKALWEQGILDEAKAMIDAATTYEKTMNDGKTWYYRGLIYASIDTSSNEAYKALESNALEVSLASFEKANDLDDGKGYATFGAYGLSTLDQQLNGYYAYYFTKAIESFENDDFKSASKLFEIAAIILPTDTASLGNAGYAAQADSDYTRAIKLFEMSRERGALSKELFNNLATLYREVDEVEKALSILEIAKAKFPDDSDIRRQEISILMSLDRLEEAKTNLENAIEKEPNDVNLRYVLALMHDEMGNEDEALKAYDAAISIDPNHYESNFNRAVILFNKANKLYKEKGLLGYSAADQKKAKDMEPAIKAGFIQALPAWESVYQIKSNERPTLQTLLFIYAYLGEEKKADKIEAELVALGEEEE